ncbi:YdbC family protein [Marasmitruncus massiliensis]|uniref:YdbC family protein n=1 Tax=Marasmitruncus massiliensis TaxID=1944642 RepID=UPI000C7C66F7|nr:PC4/YdbC family ssDNA-binding protein [Marasmitruncus massiliensis]MBE6907509.1 hypothetical protein [Oscillospiraceae bacterium]
MAELKYEITQEIAILSESSRGWTKELNLVSWNEREPKYDIREWAPDHAKMGKGVTLSEEEMQTLVNAYLHKDEEPTFD